MPGVVSIYEGAWLSWDSRGWCNSGAVNVLTSSRASSALSQATTANTCVAYLSKANLFDEVNKAYEPPKIVRSSVKLSEDVFNLKRQTKIVASELEDADPGEKLFYQKCSLCHVPRDPAGHTIREWESITKSMFINAGATEQERALILGFLRKNAKDAK